MSRGEFGGRRPMSSNGRGESEYERLCKQAGSNIQQITLNVNVMQKLVNKLGTSEDAIPVQERLQNTEKSTKSLASETSSMIKQLPLLEAEDPMEQKQRKVQVNRLRENFMDALNNFQSVQREAADRERAFVSKARAKSDNFAPFGQTEPSGISYDQGQSTTIQVQQEDEINVELLEERERAVRQLESDIMDVNEIFRDLGTMIHEQGEMIDNIEDHVVTAGTHVEEANTQLQKASEYQKASRKKCAVFW